MKIEIIGVYPIDACEPCHLFEILITDHNGVIDVGDFTQDWPGKPKSSWQVPWDERVLDATGEKDVLGPFPREIVADGDLRVVFFFHYLDFDRPLITPAGEIPVPAATDRPRRLDFLHYESPC
ncbi:MAG: hypothetical protein KDA60_14535 [Planctomycetales bacterium]|nr:hypothetical protein [Planctomycetales bacterium]